MTRSSFTQNCEWLNNFNCMNMQLMDQAEPLCKIITENNNCKLRFVILHFLARFTLVYDNLY
jgi:hypothetical protein